MLDEKASVVQKCLWPVDILIEIRLVGKSAERAYVYLERQVERSFVVQLLT